MILSGKLFPAAFVEVMLLWGKVYFHAIKKQTCSSNCFSVINLIIFVFPQTTLNHIYHREVCPGNFPVVFMQPASAAIQAVSHFTAISLHAAALAGSLVVHSK